MTPYRTMFWNIEQAWLFYLLAVLASALFLTGLFIHLLVWKKSATSLKISFSKEAITRVILDTLLGRRIFQGEVAAGLLHLFIFWGFVILFIGTALLALHDYFFAFLRGTVYLVYSFTMEVGGLLLLAGILWAVVRRYVQRVPRLERRMEDALMAVWFVAVGFSGFFVEASRIASLQPPWGHWSFVGWWMSSFLSASRAEILYPYLWWAHAGLALGLIAVIPYTKLFHILGAPAGIYLYKPDTALLLDDQEATDKWELGDAIFFDACMRCGRCVAACPSTGAEEPFAPRDFIQFMHRAQWRKLFPWGDIRFLSRNNASEADERLWYCTTCRACLEVCPIYGATFDAVLLQRALAVEEGTNVPTLMNQTLEKLFKYDNPWESSRKKRGAWADGMDLVDLTRKEPRANLCYFVGCTTSFDGTAQEIARSFSKILQRAGVDFGILGKKEPCCGDIARRTGEQGLFLEQRDNCIDLFDKYGITEIVTSSPHCFHTFLNDYPAGTFRPRHYTLLLRELLDRGALRFNREFKAKVTYHDPCYLGRYNRIFDEPREIICAIPGVTLVEMAHHGPDSLCCGGGGGRMWQDLDREGKMSEVRIREAAATGAQILITACPLCRIMLEDARKVADLTDTLQVMDLNELVLQALVT